MKIKKSTLQGKMKTTFILVFTIMILTTTILTSVIFERVYWNKSYQLCEQLVSLNLNLLNNQIIQIQKMQEYITRNNAVKNIVEYYKDHTERDYGVELKYQRDLDSIFYVLAEGAMVDNAYIIDKQGNYIYFYRESLKVKYNMLQEKWYKELLDNIKMNVSYVSGLHDRNYLVNNRDDCISMIMPIQLGSEYTFSSDAYLVCDINLNSILNVSSSKEDMQFALLDGNDELYSFEPLILNDKEEKEVIESAKADSEQVQLLRQTFFKESIVVSMKSKIFGWKLIGVKELKEIKDLNMTLFLFLCGTVLLAVPHHHTVIQPYSKEYLNAYEPADLKVQSCSGGGLSGYL